MRVLLLERRLDHWWDELMDWGGERPFIEAKLHGAALELGPLGRDEVERLISLTLEELEPRTRLNVNQDVNKLVERFFAVDDQSRPLTALLIALTATAGGSSADTLAGALRDALTYEENQVWRQAGVTAVDRNLLALATVVGGIPVQHLAHLMAVTSEVGLMKGLFGSTPAESFNPEHLRSMTGNDATTTLPSLEPDLLGEFFVLEHVRRRYERRHRTSCSNPHDCTSCLPSRVCEFLCEHYGRLPGSPRP